MFGLSKTTIAAGTGVYLAGAYAVYVYARPARIGPEDGMETGLRGLAARVGL